jgi:hypothetical protein
MARRIVGQIENEMTSSKRIEGAAKMAEEGEREVHQSS